jgi:hypothetical protein
MEVEDYMDIDEWEDSYEMEAPNFSISDSLAQDGKPPPKRLRLSTPGSSTSSKVPPKIIKLSGNRLQRACDLMRYYRCRSLLNLFDLLLSLCPSFEVDKKRCQGSL